jgi:glycosyltransferase involved in cell wall biosynthesis
VPATLSIVMPAHNEAGFLTAGVTDVVEGLRRQGETFEVIVVENGSSDTTIDEADKLSAAYDEVRYLSLPDPDYGRALRAGFLESRNDVVVNFDVDYYDLDFLRRAVPLVDGEHDNDTVIVVGTKRGAGAVDTRPASRRLVTAVFSTILRTGFGLKVSDTHGVKAMRRLPLVPIVHECRLGTDLFDTELVLRAQRAGLGVDEIGVVVEERRPSRSPIWKRIPRSLVGLARLKVVLGRK